MTKREIRTEWLKRLRSGEIQQTKEKLGSPEGSRCCLGVLCDIAVEQGVIEKPDVILNTTIGKEVLSYAGASGILPVQVAYWAGLRDTRGYSEILSEKGQYINLAVLNDSGASFHEVANTIEQCSDLFGDGDI